MNIIQIAGNYKLAGLPVAGLYICITLFLLLLGTMQGSWLDFSDQNVITSRRPRSIRIGVGMASFIFLVAAISFAFSCVNVLYTWLYQEPLTIFVVLLLIYLTGPQDVYIDTSTRSCQSVSGWIFCPRRKMHTLTEASSICICSGGQAYYVFLMIGNGTQPWFVLARPAVANDAVIIAQEIADKLQLPVRASSMQQIRTLR